VRPAYVTSEFLDSFISRALAEDIGEGDHSTLAVIPAQQLGSAQVIMKEDGVIAGLEMAEEIFRRLDEHLIIDFYKSDGDEVKIGEVVLEVKGPVRSILSAERLVLNCMQRMSGIATYTNHLSKMLIGTRTKILDTRKTTPNMRPLEKWAVLIGGGRNHRYALYDMIMLKDNHIDYAGGIMAALAFAKDYLMRTGKDLKIEIETRNLDEVMEVMQSGGADIIMLDNMDAETMKQAVDLICGTIKTEASGGITEDNIVEKASSGVDYISIGALTHSVKSLDMSLKAEIVK
jgi:nicotinate-nucleotide pyrophosphorylase (carboxylating)